MKASNLRNLIIPSIEHFTEMGLRRSTVYVARTYSELLHKYKLESNPLATPATDHLRKVKSYAETAIFIVPQKAPKYMTKPFLQYEQPPIAITLGSHDLLQKFATAFFQPLAALLISIVLILQTHR